MHSIRGLLVAIRAVGGFAIEASMSLAVPKSRVSNEESEKLNKTQLFFSTLL